MTNDATTAGYDALRREINELLKGEGSQDRLAKALLAPDPARSRDVVELARSVAEILVTACPQHDANTYAAALADATVLVTDALHSRSVSERATSYR